MGVIGERRLQELIDHAEFEVRQGTPRDIASREIFEKCAETLVEHEKLEEDLEKARADLGEYEEAVKDIRGWTNKLLDEDEDKSDPTPEDLTDVYKALAGRIDELAASALAKEEQVKELEKDLERSSRALDEERDRSSALAARLRELETFEEKHTALIERVRYLEAGLGRVLVEAFKLRKGVL